MVETCRCSEEQSLDGIKTILTEKGNNWERKYIVYWGELLQVYSCVDTCSELFVFSKSNGWQMLYKCNYTPFNDFMVLVKKFVSAL